MVELNDISVIYGERHVLDGISLRIPTSDKVGIVGKNGCGKSTLLKIIAGLHTPDKGSFGLPGETRIGFLHQDIKIDLSPKVLDATKQSLKDLKKIEDQLIPLRQKAEETGVLSDEEGIRITELEERFNMLGGYTQDAEAEQILKGLGFSPDDLNKKVGELSGGWRMRVELAKILLSKPDLLLLDEPNNHLDMESIIWLENWLQNYEGTALIVSHDTDFIENASNAILEIKNGRAFYFNGVYSRYLKVKESRMENDLQTYQNQQKELEEKQRTIDRFRAKATKAKMAKSMQKQVDKMVLVDKPEEDNSSIKIRFQPPPRSGDMVLKVQNLSKSFGDLKVLDKVDFEVRRGEKVSLVGKNGEGKTTFVRLILNELESDGGSVEIGHNVKIGYFAQNQDELLNEEMTLLEFMEEDCPDALRPKLRGILGSFLFSNDDVEKKIKVLSGGERSRLAMAKLLLKPFNLLILDEPTNHLDIVSKNILKQTIDQFEGTVILVSHDRDFLRGLSNSTWEFFNRKIKPYLGDIDYFLKKKGKENIRDFEKRDRPSQSSSIAEKEVREFTPSLSQEELFSLRKKLNKTISYSERSIQELENKIQSLELDMADPEFFDKNNAVEVTQKHRELKNHLQLENQKWEDAVEKLTSLDN